MTLLLLFYCGNSLWFGKYRRKWESNIQSWKNKSDEIYANDLDIYPKSDYSNSYYFDVDSTFLENYFWIRQICDLI